MFLFIKGMMIVSKYTYEDVEKLYREMEQTKGTEEAPKYISEVFEQAKELHKEAFLEENPNGNHDQSWRRFKGSCFEKLLKYIITQSIEELNIVSGNKLERSRQLSQELEAVKRNVMVDYGEFGFRLPDADIIVYNPEDSQVIAIISSKTSLAERVAQTSYWKLKLQAGKCTAHIKVYLITTDTKKDLRRIDTAKKSRVIAEAELDGTYVLTTEALEESGKVKLFEHFIADFKQLIEEN